jgi:sigma-B regulation protein RsbQ
VLASQLQARIIEGNSTAGADAGGAGGADRARTVVLGHGFGSTQLVWQAQVQALSAAGYDIVVFDFPGTSATSKAAYDPEKHVTLYGFAEDLATLMRELAISGATYVGHSLGGMVGALSSIMAPSIFDSLILIGSSARYIDEPASGYRGGFRSNEIEQLFSALQADYGHWARSFGPMVTDAERNPIFANEFTRNILHLDPNIACTILGAAFRADHRMDVKEIALPVQVQQAKHDPAVPPEAAEWLARNAMAKDYVVIPCSGHFPHVTAAELVNQHILRFLAALPESGSG